LEQVTAILIKADDCGENDKIVKLFTLQKGVIRAKVRGVKKKGAKLKFAAQPFCFGEYSLAERGGFYTITGCVAKESFYGIAEDSQKYIFGCLMLETASEGVRYENNPDIFVLLLDSLKNLAYSTVSLDKVMVAYLFNLAEKCGYGISKEDKTVKNLVNYLQYKLQVKFLTAQMLDEPTLM